MPSPFEALLTTIISRATSEIAGAVRANMADEVLRAVKVHVPGAPGARAVRAAPRVGRKPRVARVPAVPAKPALKAVPAKPGVPKRDALQGQVLELIAQTPGLRAEEETKRLGAKAEAVKAALAGLRAAGKVKVSGRARGTSYTAV